MSMQVRKLAGAAVFGLIAMMAAGCADKDNPLKPSTPVMTPNNGPAQLTVTLRAQTGSRFTVIYGGFVGLGLNPSDVIIRNMETYNYACGATEKNQVEGANSKPALNADTAIAKNMRACGGNIRIQLLVETLDGRRMWHPLDNFALLEATGIKNVRLTDGPNGVKMIAAELVDTNSTTQQLPAEPLLEAEDVETKK